MDEAAIAKVRAEARRRVEKQLATMVEVFGLDRDTLGAIMDQQGLKLDACPHI